MPRRRERSKEDGELPASDGALPPPSSSVRRGVRDGKGRAAYAPGPIVPASTGRTRAGGSIGLTGAYASVGRGEGRIEPPASPDSGDSRHRPSVGSNPGCATAATIASERGGVRYGPTGLAVVRDVLRLPDPAPEWELPQLPGDLGRVTLATVSFLGPSF
jgi:hypothetical protein